MSATSSSDRYDAARKALAAFENATPANGKNDNDRYVLAKEMAAALRALLEAPAVEETPESFAKALRGKWINDDNDDRNVRDLLAVAYRAGIQAAWSTWEPDDYAESNS